MAAPVTRPLFTWPGSPKKGTATPRALAASCGTSHTGREVFYTPQEAQAPIEGWRQNHNQPRPHKPARVTPAPTRNHHACTRLPAAPRTNQPQPEITATPQHLHKPWHKHGGQTLSGYLMYRKVRDADPPDEFLAYGFAEGDATGYTDTLVEADTAYASHVVAVSPHGESEPSSEVEVDTPPPDPD